MRASTTWRSARGSVATDTSSSRVADPRVRRPGRGAQRSEVSAGRRTEDPLEGAGVLRAARLEAGEDPAAVVVDHDDRELGQRFLRSEHQPVASCRNVRSPEQRVRRARRRRAARRAPRPSPWTPCRRCRTAPRFAMTVTPSRGAAYCRSRTASDEPATSNEFCGSAACSAAATARPGPAVRSRLPRRARRVGSLPALAAGPVSGWSWPSLSGRPRRGREPRVRRRRSSARSARRRRRRPRVPRGALAPRGSASADRRRGPVGAREVRGVRAAGGRGGSRSVRVRALPLGSESDGPAAAPPRARRPAGPIDRRRRRRRRRVRSGQPSATGGAGHRGVDAGPRAPSAAALERLRPVASSAGRARAARGRRG